MDLRKMRIGVFFGGVSSERNISLISGRGVVKALRDKNLDVVAIDIDTADEERIRELIFSYDIDIVFIALHGEFGEDGKIQGILERIGVPFTGSGSEASYYAMDKIVSKNIFIENNIPTPEFVVFSRGGNMDLSLIDFPAVVKPYYSGSSLGVSIVYNKKELVKALKEAFQFGEKVIIERYIEGREYSVGVLDTEPLGVIEIVPHNKFFDYEAKYVDGKCEFIAPAYLDEESYKRAQELALRAHQSLGCKGASRVDILRDIKGDFFVLEVNSIPGMTPHSLLPLSARVCGINFENLCIKMLELALRYGAEAKKKQ